MRRWPTISSPRPSICLRLFPLWWKANIPRLRSGQGGRRTCGRTHRSRDRQCDLRCHRSPDQGSSDHARESPGRIKGKRKERLNSVPFGLSVPPCSESPAWRISFLQLQVYAFEFSLRHFVFKSSGTGPLPERGLSPAVGTEFFS